MIGANTTDGTTCDAISSGKAIRRSGGSAESASATITAVVAPSKRPQTASLSVTAVLRSTFALIAGNSSTMRLGAGRISGETCNNRTASSHINRAASSPTRGAAALWSRRLSMSRTTARATSSPQALARSAAFADDGRPRQEGHVVDPVERNGLGDLERLHGGVVGVGPARGRHRAEALRGVRALRRDALDGDLDLLGQSLLAYVRLVLREELARRR